MATTISGDNGLVAPVGAVYNGLQSQTAKTATGTSVDFTDIPSWVKRITVMLEGVSTSGTSNVQIQLGDSGGVETTGYNTYGMRSSTTAVSTQFPTTGFNLIQGVASASALLYGQVVFSLLGSNTWTCFGSVAAPAVSYSGACGGSKILSDTLTKVRITTVNGTDTFDAGTINILYE